MSHLRPLKAIFSMCILLLAGLYQSRAVAQSAQATPTPSNDELRIHGVESSAGSLKLEISIPPSAGTLQANGFTLEGVAYEQADFTGLNARTAAYYTVFGGGRQWLLSWFTQYRSV